MQRGFGISAMVVAFALAACSTAPPPGTGPHRSVGRPYEAHGRTYVPRAQPGYDAVGIASWYGPYHNGRRTASGEIFDMNKPTAAHRTLPFGTLVRVTNLNNGRSVVVRINDRGPFVRGRIIDVSRYAARALGFIRNGTARVRVRLLRRARR